MTVAYFYLYLFLLVAVHLQHCSLFYSHCDYYAEGLMWMYLAIWCTRKAVSRQQVFIY
jgi:hypothetical protein